jgi:hypothetical protein
MLNTGRAQNVAILSSREGTARVQKPLQEFILSRPIDETDHPFGVLTFTHRLFSTDRPSLRDFHIARVRVWRGAHDLRWEVLIAEFVR